MYTTTAFFLSPSLSLSWQFLGNRSETRQKRMSLERGSESGTRNVAHLIKVSPSRESGLSSLLFVGQVKSIMSETWLPLSLVKREPANPSQQVGSVHQCGSVSWAIKWSLVKRALPGTNAFCTTKRLISNRYCLNYVSFGFQANRYHFNNELLGDLPVQRKSRKYK